MIKTTKETHKQDETFKSKVTFDSYDNVYANVDGEMKSLPDYIASKGSAPSNMMTTDTEQHISGAKYFTKLSIADANYKDKFDITTEISSTEKANVVTFAREKVSEVHYAEDLYIFKNADDTYQFRISVQSNKVQLSIKGAGSAIVFDLPTKGGTLMTSDGDNILTETKLTLKSNQTYTCEYMNPYRGNSNHIIVRLINDGNVYTASFDITRAYDASSNKITSKVAFLMPYGTTSDDVATCFAYFDKDDYYGYLNIDLDNCQLSTGYSVTAYYYQYN